MFVLSTSHGNFSAAIGQNGLIAAADKREGDGKTPIGRWPLREIWYRADRLQLPEGLVLTTRCIQPDDGWCDAPDDIQYNRPVKHPYPASAERLWLEEGAYDIIIPLGYNDDPVVPGRGSAIFFHLAHADGRGTAGCVAIDKSAMLTLLPHLTLVSQLEISADGGLTLHI